MMSLVLSTLQGRPSPGSASILSPGSSSSFSQSPSPSTTQNLGSMSISDFCEPYHNLTIPTPVEASSDRVDRPGDLGSSAELEVSQALQRLEEQLSLNEDNFKDFGPICSQGEDPNDADLLNYERNTSNGEHFVEFNGSEQNLWNQCSSGYHGIKGN